METFIFVALVSAFVVGLAFGVLIMSLLAIASLGDDPLPEIEIPRSPIPRNYQD